MEYKTNGKRVIRRKVTVRRGTMYTADYVNQRFDKIPVTLVDWTGEMPENVVIDSIEEMQIEIPLSDMVKMQDYINDIQVIQ